MKIKKYFSKIFIFLFIFIFSVSAFSSVRTEKSDIIKMVNNVRAEKNLPPLAENKKLNALADKKAQIMAKENNLSHTAGGYSSFSGILKEADVKYLAAGENIARNWKTPDDVMKAWLKSSGHRANILSNKFTQIGIGKAVNSKGDVYWVQLFIKERK